LANYAWIRRPLVFDRPGLPSGLANFDGTSDLVAGQRLWTIPKRAAGNHEERARLSLRHTRRHRDAQRNQGARDDALGVQFDDLECRAVVPTVTSARPSATAGF
jgi:hypothetical protein